MSKSPVW